jgi:hypothetical protein
MTGRLTIETLADAMARQLFTIPPPDQLHHERVTVDDIQRVARLYLKPDRLSYRLVATRRRSRPSCGSLLATFETVVR